MTYVSKKEKVFDLPEQDETSSVSLTNTDVKLKRFPSVSDRRAWTTEESQRYQHLYGLVNGSETNISKSTSFKYIPFDVLLAILMAEKDAIIQELLERQEDGRSGRANVLYKSDGFEDSDDDRDALIRKDAEVVSLKNKIAGLESELEDYRDTLTKAMHKLEKLDAIMSENDLLKEKNKYFEETVKYLEEKKEHLEKELGYYRNLYGPPADLNEDEKYRDKIHRWEGGDSHDQIARLSSEKDLLIQQLKELQRELETVKSNAAEVEVLRKISETTSSSLDELSKENECYKKKLESMKCLEKHIEELKKQAHTLTEKYKRESQKANDQLKVINLNTREIQLLREERDKLQTQVAELMAYESQYLSLKAKLHQVELIIDENEILNKKLIQLDRLELENEQLKMRIDHLKGTEVQVVEDKERIIHLQCVLSEQEQEMKRMLRHIEELSKSHADKNELYRLQNELEEKNGKLKKYEKQLDDIPVLESEIDLLRNKLQKCIDDFKADKDLLRRLQEELEACRKRCHELEEMAPGESVGTCETETDEGDMVDVAEELKEEPEEEKFVEFAEKGENTEDVPKEDTESQSDKPELEDKSTLIIDETLAKIESLEDQNHRLKTEVDNLTVKLSEIDLDQLIEETKELKNALIAKDERISQLNSELSTMQKEIKNYESLKRSLEAEVELLSEKTGYLKQELDLKHEYINEMQESLELERKGREFARSMIKGLEEKLEAEKAKKEVGEAIQKLQKEEANVAKQEIYLHFAREVNHLKGIVHMSKKLNKELQRENELLKEMKEFAERTENKALKNLIARLRAEVKVLKSLSKPELEGECQSLKQQVKNLLQKTDNLAEEIKELKSALDSEKSVKDFLEREVINLQAELTACVTTGNEVLGQEVSKKEFLISSLREELANAKSDLENSVNESQTLKNQNEMLVKNTNSLELEKKNLKDQINELQSRENELNKTIKELQEKEKEFIEKTSNLEEVSASLESLRKELAAEKESAEALGVRIRELEEMVKAKEDSLKAREEIIKGKEDGLKEKEESIKGKEDGLKEKEESIKGKEDGLKEKEEIIKGIEDSLKEKEETIKEKEDGLRKKEEILKVKEKELETVGKESLDATNELNKLRSQLEVLNSRLQENDASVAAENQDIPSYEKDLEEKYALEEALRKIENELDGLKGKLEECKKMEDEMVNLRSKRDSLLDKMSSFENEIESLKKKLYDFENLKNELIKLKSEKPNISEDLEVTKLYQELLEQKTEIANLKKENDILREDLNKTEGLLGVYKSLQKKIPEDAAPTLEFYTPPALLSPHSSGPKEFTEEMVRMEAHKKEMKELETQYEQKIQHLKDINSAKLKKLAEHHEKEAKFRTKSFYESINSIKSSYENDIKKLVEKHKVSIMRLQGLHEDEVQELNTTYETQMEAMQTQNENLINDLRTDSAEKMKQMREQHNRDIRDLARKYEELLKEKDSQILSERANVEASLTENTNDIKEGHKKAMESLTQFYQNNIVEIEEKHNQELKKCKKNNLKRIELMKNKYEALLTEERKKYEEQLEEMLMQLKNGEDGDNLRASADHPTPKKPPLTTSPRLDFHEVLQKILNEGLECLTFDELIMVHSKTCFIPENTMEGSGGEGEFTQRYGRGCKHRGLMAAEKEELLKRIFTLEHEMVIKQLETHEAIVNMEAAEICRVQELKNALTTAQQKNAELKRLLSDQSKHEMNLKIDRYMSDKQASFHETNVVEKIKELEKEKAEKKRLEEELQREKANVKNLTATIEAEKERHHIQRKRDADYVESIRQRLEEALNHEQMMESQLDHEVKLRGRLEAELQNFHRNTSYKSDFPSPPLEIETKAVKNIKNRDQSEMTKESKHSRSKSRRRSRLKSVNN